MMHVQSQSFFSDGYRSADHPLTSSPKSTFDAVAAFGCGGARGGLHPHRGACFAQIAERVSLERQARPLGGCGDSLGEQPAPVLVELQPVSLDKHVGLAEALRLHPVLAAVGIRPVENLMGDAGTAP
jgi:hypothetical protein